MQNVKSIYLHSLVSTFYGSFQKADHLKLHVLLYPSLFRFLCIRCCSWSINEWDFFAQNSITCWVLMRCDHYSISMTCISRDVWLPLNMTTLASLVGFSEVRFAIQICHNCPLVGKMEFCQVHVVCVHFRLLWSDWWYTTYAASHFTFFVQEM